MAEYDMISKTALLRHLDMAIECKDCPRNTDRKTYYDRCGWSEVADICNTITEFATFADVQPVKKSKWCPPLMGQGKCDTYCERCHGKIMRNSTGIFEETPFCPWRGAKMDGEQNG